MIPPRCFFAFLATFFALAVVISSSIVNAQPAGSFSLECTFRGGEGIVAPQQSLILDVILRPASPNVTVSAPLTLNAHLINLSLSEPRTLAGFTTQITPNVPLPMSFVTPDNDGLYEIALTVIHEQQTRAFLPMTVAHPHTRVQHQFVVLGSHVLPRPTGDWTLIDRRNLSLTEKPHADLPSRRLLPTLSQLPPFPRVAELPRITDFPRPVELIGLISRPFHRQDSSMPPIVLPSELDFNSGNLFLHFPAPQGHFLERSEQNPDFSALSPAGSDGYTWHVLPMDTEIGKPYLVEIDYPVNIPQTLGVAIVEDCPNWGQYADSARFVNDAVDIHVTKEIVQDAHTETVATHRILFWATTKHPDLVLVNRQPHREALFRNIRIARVVMPGMQGNQRLPKLFEGAAQRKRIGQIQVSNFFSSFVNGEETMNSSAVVTDWQGNPHPVVVVNRKKAYEETSRLLNTLSRGGYDGVTLTMLSKMSAPHVLDTYDGYEIMFRRFSNEGLTLIPAIEFDMPLPSLEQLLRQHPGIIEEIVIGDPAERRYNLLHPAVQQAMMETVLELVDRFGHHPSFGGIAIVLSPETYAQLPFPFTLYQPGDHVFMQFRQDTEGKLDVPFPDEQYLRQTLPIQQFLVQKNAVRLQFLQSKPVWETWVRWRAAKVSEFYANLAQHISGRQEATGRSNTPLYLLGGTMFDQPEIQQFCTPTLPQNFAPLQAIQLLGFDLPLLSQAESLHFLKPVIVSNKKNHAYDGLDFADIAPLFSQSGMLSGVQFVHTSSGTAAGSRSDYFVTTPAHIQSRKRFVRQLAQADVLMFMDAGVMLPFGQEPAQFDLLDTYRRLPPVPFQTFQPSTQQPSAETASSLQPLTVRYTNVPDGMIIYIVNDAPFAVEADFFFTADFRSTIMELTEHRMIRSLNRNPQRAGSHTWRASLLPYDLLAIRINDANAKIESVTVHRPPSVDDTLRQRVEELKQRVHTARDGVPPLNGLVNADFESPVFGRGVSNDDHTARKPVNAEWLPDTEAIIPGWQRYGNSLIAVLDQTVASTGQHSVKLTNNSAEPGTFASQPFDLPATGRLDVSMFIGVPAESQSLPLSVVLSAKHLGQPLHRSAPIGETLMPLLANVEPRNGVRWHRVIVPFRFPLEPLEEVRIGVQYSGIGTIWIDDIALQHVSFSPNEIIELHKKLAVADRRYSAGRVSDLISLLEGHWTQFLFEHVPVSMPQPAVSMAKPPITTEIAAPPPSPTLYQRVRELFGR